MNDSAQLTQRQKRRLRTAYASAVVACALVAGPSMAQTFEWDAGGADSNWNTTNNWNPNDVPGVPANNAEVALFSNLGSAKPVVAANTDITLSGIQYSGSTAYTITQGNNIDLTLNGFGIDNQSTATQTFSLNHQNATLTFNNDAEIVGGAGVVINNGGTTTFNGTSSAGSDVTINNTKTVIFNSESDAGSATINNSANGATTTFNDDSSALDATINNTARGTTVFNDDSDAGNAIINNTGVNNGQRSDTVFNDDSDAGTALITNNAYGRTIFNDDSTAGRVDGNAEIINQVNGETLFEDQSSAENAIIRNQGGSTTFDTSGTNANTGLGAGAGTAQIFNTDGGDTFFEGTSNAQDATIVNDGAGSTTEFSNNTGAGTSDITNRNGGETIFSGGDAESAVITNEDGGTTTFEGNADAGDYNTGGLIINQVGGTTVFGTGAPTADNARIENDGVIDLESAGGPLGIGSIDGSGNVLLGNTHLDIGNLNLDDTISGDISGVNGTLTKVGTGNLVLSGTNTYTGDTTVEEGTLTVDGSITSDTEVETNGTLSGAGTIFGTLDIMGGTLQPGSIEMSSPNRYGQLRVEGPVTLDDNSTFITNVNGAQNSSLFTTDTADLDGDLAVNVDGSFGLQRTYEVVITDNGINGTFDNSANVTIIGGNPDFEGFATYDAFIAYLTLRRTTLGLPTDLTENEESLARALNDWYNNNPDQGTIDDYNEFFEVLLNGDVKKNLSKASGDAHTAFPVAAQGASRRFLERLLTQMRQEKQQQASMLSSNRMPRLVYSGTRYAALLAAAADESAKPLLGTIGKPRFKRQSNIWATIGRAREDADSDGNGPGFDARATEYQIGYSRELSERTILGIALGKSDGRIDIDDRDSNGDIDTTSIGLSLRHDRDNYYLLGGFSYSRHDIETERELGGFEYRGDTDGRTIEFSGEIGKKIARGGWNIEPNISLNIANTRQDGFEESGGGGSLDVDDASFNSRRLGLGVRFSSNNASARFRPYAFAGYQREFGDLRVDLDNSLSGIGGFDVEGTELGRNIWRLKLGADGRINDRLSVIGEIGASWRKNQDSLSIYGGMKYGF